RGHNPLEIAGKNRQFRLDELDGVFKRNLTLEDTHARHIERHAFSFEMQEDRVPPGKTITLLMVLHHNSPSGSPREPVLSSRKKTASSASPACALCRLRCRIRARRP